MIVKYIVYVYLEQVMLYLFDSEPHTFCQSIIESREAHPYLCPYTKNISDHNTNIYPFSGLSLIF